MEGRVILYVITSILDTSTYILAIAALLNYNIYIL